MDQRILFIALDVDDKNYTGHAIFEGCGDDSGKWFKCKPNMKSLLKEIEKIATADCTIHFCYESTYCAFHLCRAIRDAGYECTVIASGLIPEMPGVRVKNDRLDAKKLAIYFSKGLLTAVHVPEVEDEQERLFVRSRTFMREQLKDLRSHIVSLTKQLGWSYREEHGSGAAYWTAKHRNWLRQMVKEASPIIQKNFEIFFSQMDSLEARLSEYTEQIEKLAGAEKYAKKVTALKCYRGIDVLTAMILVTEIGDIRRFSHPKHLVSYAGMDIAEYSSGGKERRFSITKMGNKRIRRILCEAVQSANKPPILSRDLKRRREGADLKYIDVAERCMKRLNKKFLHLLYKGKPANKAKTACSREMLGFIWESLNLTV